MQQGYGFVGQPMNNNTGFQNPLGQQPNQQQFNMQNLQQQQQQLSQQLPQQIQGFQPMLHQQFTSQPFQQTGSFQPMMPLQTGIVQPNRIGNPGLGPQQTALPLPLQPNFLSSFMPALGHSQGYVNNTIAFAQPGLGLQQIGYGSGNATGTGGGGGGGFTNQNQGKTIPWKLSKEELEKYDRIFKAWDLKKTGFISGEVAKEVFGQSGLGQNDLLSIWNLADSTDRGKLNVDEFHVAMGLVYRKLNGNPIPESLPEEMIPRSSKEVVDSLNFMEGLLRNEVRVGKFDENNKKADREKEIGISARYRNASDYKFDNEGNSYKSNSRYVDRTKVLNSSGYEGEIESLRSNLRSAESVLEKSKKADEDFEDKFIEIRRLNKLIDRIREDLEDNLSIKRRNERVEAEKRKLERELIKAKADAEQIELDLKNAKREKERNRLKYTNERDRRNNQEKRFDDEVYLKERDLELSMYNYKDGNDYSKDRAGKDESLSESEDEEERRRMRRRIRRRDKEERERKRKEEEKEKVEEEKVEEEKFDNKKEISKTKPLSSEERVSEAQKKRLKNECVG